jgi:cobalt-zinc-cadmium efflux system membrane fusion protein
MKIYLILIVLLFSLPARAGDGHDHDAKEDHGDSVEINQEVAEALGIKQERAETAIIQNRIKVHGSVTLNQNSAAKIKARFPGMVKSVTKSVGDKINAGETLATVESNESLQVYAIKAPISGIIMERNLNPGDEAGEEAIMVVADLTKLWAELYIFSKEAGNIVEGQKVIIKQSGSDLVSESYINVILPYAENSSQTIIARAVINNQDGKWRPGYTIMAEIVTSETEAKIAVKTSALQKYEGKDIVFINDEGKFEAREVTIGISNDEWSEVTEGLAYGETYVSNGSFIIKAEMGKSSAEHQH